MELNAFQLFQQEFVYLVTGASGNSYLCDGETHVSVHEFSHMLDKKKKKNPVESIYIARKNERWAQMPTSC